VSPFNGREAAQEIHENVERVRRAVLAEYRNGRTTVVYSTAAFMYDQHEGLTGEQIALVFEALAWAAESS
jgi:hypothetical protein